MAFTPLRTDYKDDELNESVNTNVVFIETDIDSGVQRNITLQDATAYTQMGDQLSASVLNEIGTVVNNIGTHLTAAENTLSGIMDVFYPVGSYYETSDLYFDPNVSWGGTWVLESGGRVHISSGKNEANTTGAWGQYSANSDDWELGEMGGETKHTLQAAESGNQAQTITSGGQSNGHTHAVYGGAFLTGTGNVKVNTTGRAWPSGAGSQYYVHADAGVGIGEASTTLDVSAGHTHSISVAAKNATNAHTQMPPYVVVNRWHRTD